MLFQRVAGVEMVHVPYKGGAPAVQSVLAGDTQLSFATPPSVLPLVQAGRLRALAITSRNAQRRWCPACRAWPRPGCPTTRSRSGTASSSRPARRPRVMQRLFDETAKALKLPQVAQALAKEGTETSGSASPADFAAFLAEDAKLWSRLVKDSGA